MISDVASPDRASVGLTTSVVDPLRYDAGWSEDAPVDPAEVGGLLRTMMPEGVRVLDVGAGTGGGTLTINRDKANTLIAVEPDEERAAVCRARGIQTYTGFLDEALAGEIGPVDVVMLTDVLEHVNDPADLLETVRNILTDNGLVLASVPNVAHWSIRMRLLLGRFDYKESGLMDATHLRWFTTRSLSNLFKSCGFGIVEFRHTAGTWLPEYHRSILRRVPYRYKRTAINAAIRLAPNLFGCQHIIKAVKSH